MTRREFTGTGAGKPAVARLLGLLVLLLTLTGGATGADAAIVYTEQPAKGPIGELLVRVDERDRGGIFLGFEVVARTPGAIPASATVTVSFRDRADVWRTTTLEPVEELGRWRSRVTYRHTAHGELTVRVTSADGTVLQEIGRRTQGARRVVLQPEAPRFDMPPATFEDPVVIYDNHRSRGHFERVQVGLYPDDPHGLSAVFTVVLRSIPDGEPSLHLDWNPVGGTWESVPLTRVGPDIWVGDLLGVPRGDALMAIELQTDGTVRERFGTVSSPMELQVAFAPDPGEEPAAPRPPEDDGFVTLYTEKLAAHPVTDLRVAVDPEGPPQRIKVEVDVDEAQLGGSPAQVIVDLNAKRSSWNAIPLRWAPDTGRWSRTIRIPEYGPAYIAVRVVDERGDVVAEVGRHHEGARRVDLHPATARRDIPATTARHPRLLFERLVSGGLIHFAEVAGFLRDPEGIMLRLRVQLDQPVPGARVRAGINGESAPWVVVDLESQDKLTFEGFVGPVSPGDAFLTLEVADAHWALLDTFGSRSRPVHFRVDLSEQAEQPFTDPDP